jgi:hypothetical protein
LSADQGTVPLSHALGMGQWDTSTHSGDTRWDTRGTVDLKALARKALSRDSSWDSSRDSAELSVPQGGREKEARGTPSDRASTDSKKPSVGQDPEAAGAPRTSQSTSPLSNGPVAGSAAQSDSAESRSPTISDPEVFEERAALIEYGAGVPREWAEGFARLDMAQPPKGFDERRWRMLIDDGGKFLDRWGGEAARLGWSVFDVFGAHPIAPGARCDAAGLVTLIDGGEVIAIKADRATIRSCRSSSELTYLRTPRAGVVALWDLLSSE